MRLWPKANESLKPAPFAVLADAAEPAWSSRGGWVNKLLFKVCWGSLWKEVTSGKYLVAGVHCLSSLGVEVTAISTGHRLLLHHVTPLPALVSTFKILHVLLSKIYCCR